MLRILDRYVSREMVVTFAISMATLTFVILIHRIMLLIDLILSKGVEPFVVLRLFLYSVPISLEATVPTSALVASIAVYARMAADNETMALKAAGVNPLRLQAPAIAFGVAASTLSLYALLDAMPYSARAFRDLAFEIARQQAMFGLQEGTFNTDFDGLTLYVQRTGPDGSLENVFVEDRREPSTWRVVVARRGRLAMDRENFLAHLKLHEGTIHFTSPIQRAQYRLLSFQEYDMTMNIGGRLADAAERRRWGLELTVQDLHEEASRLRAQGHSDAPLWVEIHRRFALPFSSLFFAVIGSGLGLRVRRAKRNVSVLLGVGVGAGYYLLLTGARALGSNGYLAPAWAMWMPNFVLALLGLWLGLTIFWEGQPWTGLDIKAEGRNPAH